MLAHAEGLADDVHGIARAVGEIDARPHAVIDERAVDARHPGHQEVQLVQRCDRVDAVELGLDRLDAGGVDRVGIHVRAVEIADELRRAALRRGGGLVCGLGNGGFQLRLHLLGRDVENAIADKPLGPLDTVEPFARGVTVEVFRGIDAGVHVLDREAELIGADRRNLGTLGERGAGKNERQRGRCGKPV